MSSVSCPCLTQPLIFLHLSLSTFFFSCNLAILKSLMVSHFYKINSKLLGTRKALCDLALIIFSDLIFHFHTQHPLFQPHWILLPLPNKPCAFVLLSFNSCNFLYPKCFFQISSAVEIYASFKVKPSSSSSIKLALASSSIIIASYFVLGLYSNPKQLF
jgi:hypothetical protein